MLDTGDALVGGGILGDRSEGRAVVAGMTLMGYDAMALGPNELSLGPAKLAQRMQEAGFPMLSANVTGAVTSEPVAPAYALFDVAGVRLAVVGLTRTPAEQVAGFDVAEPRAALETALTEVSTVADTVILLTNVDFATALAYSMIVPGIDITVAALPATMPTSSATAPNTLTIVVAADKSEGANRGRHIGHLQVDVHSDGSVEYVAWQTVALTYKIANDPAMTELLERFKIYY